MNWAEEIEKLNERNSRFAKNILEGSAQIDWQNEKIAELGAENQRQREALDAVWEALDGLYGADSGEELPIDLLPEDRQQLFHKALELVGGTLNREQVQ